MKAIGVRELKANLSRYLREVRAGEVLLVTDRGHVVAEIRAPGVTQPVESEIDRAFRRLASTLPMTIGEPHDPSTYRTSPLSAPDGTARAVLDEDRGDR
jgi:antitoxin (DNA-binding transcriptional repressor) of toxin-antitoxin stability system